MTDENEDTGEVLGKQAAEAKVDDALDALASEVDPGPDLEKEPEASGGRPGFELLEGGADGGPDRAARGPARADREPVVTADEIEEECELAFRTGWGALARLAYGVEIPEEAWPDRPGERLSGPAAAVLNKWLPRLSSRWSEELRLAASAGLLSLPIIVALQEERRQERDENGEQYTADEGAEEAVEEELDLGSNGDGDRLGYQGDYK